jgi:hypothetical protein
MIARWEKAIRLHQRHPQYAWRRAMLHKFIRPLAEFGLMLATWTPELMRLSCATTDRLLNSC